MSILEKVGLSEDQVKSIQSVEIQRLVEQEKVLKESVEKLARETDELFIKKRNTAELAEALKMEVAENEKKANLRLGDAQKKEAELKVKTQEHLAREERFRLEKEQFVKDRSALANDLKAYEEKKESLEALEKDIAKKQQRLNEDYDLLEDKKFYIDGKLNELSKAELSIKEKEKALFAKESEFKHLENSLSSERSKLADKAASDKAKLEAEKAEFLKKIESQEIEITEKIKSLKSRELEIIRKEKEIKNQELEIKAKREDLEIKLANAEAKEEKPVFSDVPVDKKSKKK